MIDLSNILFDYPDNSKSFLDYLGPIGGLAQGLINFFSGKSTNKSNERINERNLEYNAAMTQAQWERDDNAHQREVADLKAAGLSPLAATNGAQTTSALNAPNPIAMQAPQLDINTAINAALESKALNETKRHNLAQEGQKNSELILQAEELDQKAEQIDLENRKLDHQIKYNFQYLSQIDRQLAEAKRHNMKEEELKKLSYMNEYALKQIQQQTHGKYNYKVYSDFKEYEAALQIWQTVYIQLVNDLQETSKTSSQSNSSSTNVSAGVNAGTSVTGTPLGVNGGLNGSYGSSDSNSESSSYNISQKQQAMMDKWIQSHPMPVYIYKLY